MTPSSSTSNSASLVAMALRAASWSTAGTSVRATSMSTAAAMAFSRAMVVAVGALSGSSGNCL